MSSPKVSDLRRLRKIGKYLLGCPRLVSEFKHQAMPSVITTFTDSDWAGCARSAKSTSGGAVCIGEHVIKTYCKQQKVIALSSAEAELYAMVAASAETLALQAYARDLGLDFGCELYCDSAAALGIAQRAGIGKVRHLRTQGLWVQEVRISGRINYLKVLGEKNPADLLTKHMSAELANRHITTLNMRLSSGRAETAPTLDSLVQAWYSEDGKDVAKSRGDGRRVHFASAAQYRPIPAEGRGRRTPARGSRSLDRAGRSLDTCEEMVPDDCEEYMDVKCLCDKPGLLRRAPWADADEDAVCVLCASTWSAMDNSRWSSIASTALAENGEMRPEMRPIHREPNPCERSRSNTDHTVGSPVAERAHSSIRNKSHSGIFEGSAHNRLMSGGSSTYDPSHVPTLERTRNSCGGSRVCHSLTSAPCLMRRRRRRSVGSGPHLPSQAQARSRGMPCHLHAHVYTRSALPC